MGAIDLDLYSLLLILGPHVHRECLGSDGKIRSESAGFGAFIPVLRVLSHLTLFRLIERSGLPRFKREGEWMLLAPRSASGSKTLDLARNPHTGGRLLTEDLLHHCLTDRDSVAATDIPFDEISTASKGTEFSDNIFSH
jgi:hypothetical protein